MKRLFFPWFLLIFAVVIALWLFGRNGFNPKPISSRVTATKQAGPEGNAVNTAKFPGNESGTPKPMAKPPMDWMAEIRLQWSDPAAQAMAKREALGRVEQRYGRFFQTVRLTPQQLEWLKQQMAENDIEMAKAYLPNSADPGDAERQKTITAANQLKLQQMELLRRQLGDDVADELRNYERDQSYRPMIESIANNMRSNGVSVSEETQNKIVSTYADVLARVGSEAGKDSKGIDLSHLSQSGISALRQKQMERFDRELAEAMAQTLDQSTFRAFMDGQLRMENK
jgi:hypothetical protein